MRNKSNLTLDLRLLQMTMSEKRQSVLATNEKIHLWNCLIEKFVIALSRAEILVSTV
jgi:hypothetical protein